ncbi:MAG: DUF6754 domain-containing protein [Alphaproteobacteria bacterium]|jgi:hypothetical protein
MKMVCEYKGQLSLMSNLSPISEEVNKSMQFMEGSIFAFVCAVLVGAAILDRVRAAKSGGFRPEIRRIAGLDAIDEAVARATEMAGSVVFSPGIGRINTTEAPQSLAGLAILGYVANLAARYNTRLVVAISAPDVLPLAQETVRQAYAAQGVGGQYNQEETVRYLGEQWSFATAMTGIISRERVSANIMMGAYYAEALVSAEAGVSVGAIQIAGTANMAQLPFFVASCDYVILGEELYVAAAYLSGDEANQGAIVGADYAKLGAIIVILLGSIMATLGSPWLVKLMSY